MKNVIRTAPLLLAFTLGSGIQSFARAAQPCPANLRLSDDEAQILLYMTPAAIDARNAGTDVDIERSESTQEYPAADFFAATLVSQERTRNSVLGNGVLGVFVVDRRTGEVQSMGNFKAVKGKELDRVRGWLIHAHCPAN